MSELKTDVKSLLSTVSNMCYGDMPTTPNNVVCFYHTGGYARSSSGTHVEEPTFQIRVRNTSYETGYKLCNTIKDLLHCKSTGGIIYCEQMGDILDLGKDENERSEFSMNFRAYYRR